MTICTVLLRYPCWQCHAADPQTSKVRGISRGHNSGGSSKSRIRERRGIVPAEASMCCTGEWEFHGKDLDSECTEESVSLRSIGNSIGDSVGEEICPPRYHSRHFRRFLSVRSDILRQTMRSGMASDNPSGRWVATT